MAICQGWGGKISGFALRLAGLLHIAEHAGATLTISASTMENALELATLLTEHALAAYGAMGEDPVQADARLCWDWIEAQGAPSFIQRDLTYALRHRLKAERITPALRVLIDRALISEPEVTGIPGRGRLRTSYAVNPATPTPAKSRNQGNLEI